MFIQNFKYCTERRDFIKTTGVTTLATMTMGSLSSYGSSVSRSKACNYNRCKRTGIIVFIKGKREIVCLSNAKGKDGLGMGAMQTYIELFNIRSYRNKKPGRLPGFLFLIKNCYLFFRRRFRCFKDIRYIGYFFCFLNFYVFNYFLFILFGISCCYRNNILLFSTTTTT